MGVILNIFRQYKLDFEYYSTHDLTAIPQSELEQVFEYLLLNCCNKRIETEGTYFE